MSLTGLLQDNPKGSQPAQSRAPTRLGATSLHFASFTSLTKAAGAGANPDGGVGALGAAGSGGAGCKAVLAAAGGVEFLLGPDASTGGEGVGPWINSGTPAT